MVNLVKRHPLGRLSKFVKSNGTPCLYRMLLHHCVDDGFAIGFSGVTQLNPSKLSGSARFAFEKKLSWLLCFFFQTHINQATIWNCLLCCLWAMINKHSFKMSKHLTPCRATKALQAMSLLSQLLSWIPNMSPSPSLGYPLRHLLCWASFSDSTDIVARWPRWCQHVPKRRFFLAPRS